MSLGEQGTMAEEPVREPGAEWLVTPGGVDRNPAGSSMAPAWQNIEVARQPGEKTWHPIAMTAIRALAQRIVDRFQPEKIILFGSYASGRPRPESDVDLLVIMETSLRSRQQRLEISRALSPRPFPLDLIVRTPQELAQRVALGDPFLAEIMTRGKVLYERNRS